MMFKPHGYQQYCINKIIEIKKNRAFFGHGLMVWERQSRP